jgi:ankyrin
VGGFGGCEFMYNAIQSALAKYRGEHYDKIVRPHLPNLAVVKGAVMWRQDPSIIQSRRADATYGMCISEVFDATRHSRSYQYRCSEEGVDRCGAIFKVFIEKGETTEFDDVYTTFGDPVNQSDTELCVPIYSTTNGVQYVRDKNGQWIVEEVGKLVIEVPNPDNFPKHKRRIRYCVSFSGTEIRATATYQIDGTEDKEKEVKIVCDFLDDASN